MKHKESIINSSQIKKHVINVMIGSLVGAAAIAVAAVLIGEFNDILSKSLFTLVVVMVHALASLGFLDSKTKKNNSDELIIFTNTIFILIVLSFVSSIFGIWGIFSGSLLVKLYSTYFITAFAVSHGEILYKASGVDKKINSMIHANYVFMCLVVGLILAVIWVGEVESFPSMYYRLLSAAAIIDTTLTVLIAILYKLHLQKHPELKKHIIDNNTESSDSGVAGASKTRKSNPVIIILGIFLFFQFIVPVFYLILNLLFSL